MKMLFYVLVGAYAILASNGVSAQADVEAKGFALASNHFGLNCYRQLSSENGNSKNLFFSPYSVATALAMVHHGAAGDTAKQLESTLGFELAALKNPGVEIQQEALLLKGSDFENETYSFRTANALLVGGQSSIKDSYKSDIRNQFEAELFSFGDKAVDNKILVNQWVSNKTDGKISELLDSPPSADAAMILLNAVFFKGLWLSPFKKENTKPAPFYGTNNVTNPNVMFMKRTKGWQVSEMPDVKANLVVLPYVQGNMSLNAILPEDPAADLSSIRNSLTPSYLNTAMSQIHRRSSTVYFPKFNFKTKYDMRSTMQGLGLAELFTDKADLSKASEIALKISKVKHAATIEVDEKGTIATAATYIEAIPRSGLGGRGQDQVYRFDHPFIFFIQHHPTGQILFIGEVNQL